MTSLRVDGRAILLIGAGGQLGGEFTRQLQRQRVPLVLTTSASGRRPVSAHSLQHDPASQPTVRQLDVRDDKALATLIDEVAPAVVINASAYTAVDQAESDSYTAHLVNAIAPGIMAERCSAHGATLVHFSTDYVFDGHATRAYTEEDSASPLNEYGRSKLHGERVVLEKGAAHFVFRTSWLYTANGRNFVTTMLRLFRRNDPVRVVNDQFGCPTWARHLAGAIVGWLMDAEQFRLAQVAGLYHLCSSGTCSWYEFADAIRERMSPPACANLFAIDSVAYGAAACRPAHSALDCTLADKVLKLHLPHWTDALDAAMPEFLEADSSAC